jgi:anthraniloyl-CoA monooxygenase
VALGHPHLVNPYFTRHAAAHYGFEEQFWPNPCLAGKLNS